jgi:PBP1b-binding outer membrane lipoprotein LpoB
VLKRSIFFAAAAALALTGCSGGETKPEPKKEASAKPAKKGKKGKKKPADVPHANPWAKEAPAGAAPEQAAKAPVKKGKKKKKPEAEHTNPWAKEGPAPASEG